MDEEMAEPRKDAGRFSFHPHILPPAVSMKFLPLAFAACLAGCASHQFAAPDATWSTRTGQLHYREGSHSLIGEVALSTKGSNALLEFTKGPGLSLMRVQRDATHARFDGPLARLGHTITLTSTPSGRDAAWLEVVGRASGASRATVSGAIPGLRKAVYGGTSPELNLATPAKSTPENRVKVAIGNVQIEAQFAPGH
jgi:hypothetical protein